MDMTRWALSVVALAAMLSGAPARAEETGDPGDKAPEVKVDEAAAEKAAALRKKAGELRELGEEAMAKALEKRADSLEGQTKQKGKMKDGQPKRRGREGRGPEGRGPGGRGADGQRGNWRNRRPADPAAMLKMAERMEDRAKTLKEEGKTEEADKMLARAKQLRSLAEKRQAEGEAKPEGAKADGTETPPARRQGPGLERALKAQKEFAEMKSEVARLKKDLAAIKALLREIAGDDKE